MAENRSNVFYSLSYTHNEIDELLRKIAAGNVLLAADYDKLVNTFDLFSAIEILLSYLP